MNALFSSSLTLTCAPSIGEEHVLLINGYECVHWREVGDGIIAVIEPEGCTGPAVKLFVEFNERLQILEVQRDEFCVCLDGKILEGNYPSMITQLDLSDQPF